MTNPPRPMDEALHDAPADGEKHLGPYRLIERLGQGGMGIVYRAEHRETRQLVALKTVRLRDRRHLEGLQREIHALGRLRHPGVVRLLDEQLAHDPPWYAMELVRGQTLRRYREQVLVEPDALLKILTIVRRLCNVLFYLHGEGLAHRDLKPENIMIRAASGERLAASEDQRAGASAEPRSAGEQQRQDMLAAHSSSLAPQDSSLIAHHSSLAAQDSSLITHHSSLDAPVLVDFGLLGQWPMARLAPREGGETHVKPDGRELLDLDVPAGTAHYMAPEQIRGHLTDARADLYALGCVLYELLTGQPPFPHATVSEVLAAQQFEAPRAPSRLCPALPEDLDRLVLDLLEKEPRRRPGSAAAVAARLARLGAENGFGAEASPARLYLYRPGFAGRGTELSRLRQALEGLVRGRGAVALVGGQSGIGKTRLALEFAREARRSGSLVLAGKCLDIAGRPLEALLAPLQSIAEHCRKEGPTETLRVLGGRAALLAAYESGFRELPGLYAEAEPAPLPADDARRRLLTGLMDVFQALTERRPVVLILDDLQWADELLFGFLQVLLESDRLDRCALFAVGTFRTEECPERLAGLLSRPRTIAMELGLLPELDVAGIAADLLGVAHLPQGLGARLAHHAAGTPLALVEIVRSLVEVGVIRLGAEGDWQLPIDGAGGASRLDEALSVLPPTLEGLIRRRLADLPETARAVAEAAAVVGHETSAQLLAAISGIQGSELFGGIADLLRTQLFEEPEPGRLRFVHDKLREVTEEQVDAPRRQRLHRAAAEVIEALDEVARRRYLGDLGRHWEAVGEEAKARDCYLDAARQALARASLEEASQHAEGSRRLGGGVAALLLLAEARHLLALSEAALEAAEEALRSIDADELQRNRAQLLRIRIQEQRGAYAESLAAAEAFLLEGPPPLVGLEAAVWKGRVLWRLGRATEAAAVLDETRNALKRHLDSGAGPDFRPTLALCLTNLGNVALWLNRYDEALTAHLEAAVLRRQLGDLHGLAGTLNGVGAVELYQGKLEAAEQAFREALALWRRIGGLAGEAAVLTNLGVLLHLQGRFARALEAHDRALALSRELQDGYRLRSVLGNRGTALRRLGDLQAAQQIFTELARLGLEAGDRQALAKTHSQLGLIAMDRGDLELAIDQFQKGVEHFSGLGYRTGQFTTIAELGTVYLRLGDYDRSAALYERALEGLAAPEFRPHRTDLLRGRGQLLLARGRYDEAQADLEAALDTARDIGYSDVLASILATLGTIHASRGRLDEAREALEAALALADEKDAVADRADVLRTRGWLHLIEGQPEAARGLLEESAAVASSKGLVWQEASARSILSRVGFAVPSPRAFRDAEMALALWRKVGNPLEAGATLATIGRLHAHERRIEVAFESLAEARRLLPGPQDPNLYLRLLEDEAAIRLEAGDVQGARETVEEARSLAGAVGADGLWLAIDRLTQEP